MFLRVSRYMCFTALVCETHYDMRVITCVCVCVCLRAGFFCVIHKRCVCVGSVFWYACVLCYCVTETLRCMCVRVFGVCWPGRDSPFSWPHTVWAWRTCLSLRVFVI